jgi:UDP-N-acetylglucosamine 2-epimerase
VAHVEAGLRSGDLSMPEEHNRIEVDRISSLLFTPDERSRDVLIAEGVSGRIDVVGDVMADASMRLAPLARERSTILSRHGVEPGGYAVATVHREANVRPERLARILDGLSRLDERVIFPAHPRTRRTIASNTVLLGTNVALLDPLGYMDFAALASQARVILTDSGGLQKEAYWYGVPCITLRPSTEWKDTVELGANVLVDDDPAAIAEAAANAHMPPNRPVLYGDGHAADRIAERLISL